MLGEGTESNDRKISDRNMGVSFSVSNLSVNGSALRGEGNHAHSPKIVLLCCKKRSLPFVLMVMKANCFVHRHGSTQSLFAGQLAELARRTGYCARRLAGALGLTRRTLERRFHRQLGCAPGEWLLRVRMSDAMALLEWRFSTKEVATALAYEDRCSFAREFQRRLACTPAEYQSHHFGVPSRRLEPPARATVAEVTARLSQSITFARLPLRRAEENPVRG